MKYPYLSHLDRIKTVYSKKKKDNNRSWELEESFINQINKVLTSLKRKKKKKK